MKAETFDRAWRDGWWQVNQARSWLMQHQATCDVCDDVGSTPELPPPWALCPVGDQLRAAVLQARAAMDVTVRRDAARTYRGTAEGAVVIERGAGDVGPVVLDATQGPPPDWRVASAPIRVRIVEALMRDAVPAYQRIDDRMAAAFLGGTVRIGPARDDPDLTAPITAYPGAGWNPDASVWEIPAAPGVVATRGPLAASQGVAIRPDGIGAGWDLIAASGGDWTMTDGDLRAWMARYCAGQYEDATIVAQVDCVASRIFAALNERTAVGGPPPTALLERLCRRDVRAVAAIVATDREFVPVILRVLTAATAAYGYAPPHPVNRTAGPADAFQALPVVQQDAIWNALEELAGPRGATVVTPTADPLRPSDSVGACG